MKTETLDTLDRLYEELVDRLYGDPDAGQARALADRLDALLSNASESDLGAIFTEECRSLVSEARGDLASAIKHRENEVRLIRRLLKISRNKPGEKYVFGQYDYSDLSDRLDLLAMLYHAAGRLDKAIRTLEESKRLCDDHDIKFDGEDILQEYLQERPRKVRHQA